ncbi:MAG: hypothetical protein Q9218_007027 [Villophora microphyllina]
MGPPLAMTYSTCPHSITGSTGSLQDLVNTYKGLWGKEVFTHQSSLHHGPAAVSEMRTIWQPDRTPTPAAAFLQQAHRRPSAPSRFYTKATQDRIAQEVFDRFSALQAQVERLRVEDRDHLSAQRSTEHSNLLSTEASQASHPLSRDQFDEQEGAGTVTSTSYPHSNHVIKFEADNIMNEYPSASGIKHQDEAVTERNKRRAATRVKSALSPNYHSFHGSAKLGATRSPVYLHSYRPPDHIRTDSNAEGAYLTRSFNNNSKRSRFEREQDEVGSLGRTPLEPIKRVKVDVQKAPETLNVKPLHRITRLASLKRQVTALEANSDVIDEFTRRKELERLAEEQQRVRRRRHKLDQQHELAKGIAIRPTSVAAWPIPVWPPFIFTRDPRNNKPAETNPKPATEPAGMSVAHLEAASTNTNPKPRTNTATPPFAPPKGIATDRLLVMTDIVGQIAKVTDRVTDLEGIYRTEKQSHTTDAMTGLTHAIISNTKTLYMTATGIATEIIRGEDAVQERDMEHFSIAMGVNEPTSQTEGLVKQDHAGNGYGTGEAVENLIAHKRAASGMMHAQHPQFRSVQHTSQPRHTSAAELNDQEYSLY